jgi:hypothetical protein
MIRSVACNEFHFDVEFLEQVIFGEIYLASGLERRQSRCFLAEYLNLYQ